MIWQSATWRPFRYPEPLRVCDDDSGDMRSSSPRGEQRCLGSRDRSNACWKLERGMDKSNSVSIDWPGTCKRRDQRVKN
jgi:hypothetical protein